MRSCAALAFFLLFGPEGVVAHPEIEDEIRHLTELIEGAPEESTAEIYLRRGELFMVHKEWNNALSDFERAESLNPSLANLHRSRGRTLQEMGRPDEAVAELDQFLKAAPRESGALLVRARAHAALGRFEDADRDYAEAICFGKSPGPELYLERAGSIETGSAAGAEERALAIYDDGVARLGPLPSLLLPAIELERDRGEFERALERIDMILSSGGSRVQWLKLRGDVLVEARRLSCAKAAYLEAMAEYSGLAPRQKTLRPVQGLKSQIEAALNSLSATAGLEERKEELP